MCATPKNSDTYEQIFRSGKQFRGKFVSLYFRKGEKNSIEPLFCVAKKIFNTKPERNRLRRLLKEAFRQQKDLFKGLDGNFALMVVSKQATVKGLLEDLADLASKALKI